MTAVNVMRTDTTPPQRWRNGGGWTRELLAWPPGPEWILRVSVADIETSGPFSEFPGVDRLFAVISGSGVILRSGGEPPITMTAGRPLHEFSGDGPTTCDLIDGPVRDVNLMVRRSRGRVLVQDLAMSPALSGCAPGVGLFVTSAAPLVVADHPPIELPALTLAWIDNPEREPYVLRVDGAARGWWVELRLP